METSIPYLARDSIFDIEKPFDTDVPVNHIPGAFASNHITDERAVTIHPITDPSEWDLEKHGFCFIRARTELKAEDALTRKREVQKEYWFEIEALLHENFPQYSRIECYDCTVRKRDLDFPIKVRTYTDVEQPARRPHSDCSPRGAYLNLERVFPGQESFWEAFGDPFGAQTTTGPWLCATGRPSTLQSTYALMMPLDAIELMRTPSCISMRSISGIL